MDAAVFFFNDTATTEIYTLSLHDALPISRMDDGEEFEFGAGEAFYIPPGHDGWTVGSEPAVILDITGMENYADRKSTRLNSSHANISYAVFCLKKKK